MVKLENDLKVGLPGIVSERESGRRLRLPEELHDVSHVIPRINRGSVI